MKGKSNRFSNIKFLIFITTILVSFFLVGQTNSRYISGATSDTDLIAKAILTLNNNTIEYTEENLLPR